MASTDSRIGIEEGVSQVISSLLKEWRTETTATLSIVDAVVDCHQEARLSSGITTTPQWRGLLLCTKDCLRAWLGSGLDQQVQELCRHKTLTAQEYRSEAWYIDDIYGASIEKVLHDNFETMNFVLTQLLDHDRDRIDAEATVSQLLVPDHTYGKKL